MHLAGGEVELFNNIIYNNEADNGNAAVSLSGINIVIANNTIAYNVGNVYFLKDQNFIEMQFVNNIVFGNVTKDGNTTSISYGNFPTGMNFYNNATGLVQSSIDESSWQHDGNIFLSSSIINAPQFIGGPSFAGKTADETEKTELESVNFNILQTSPCFDTGKTESSITHDIVGTARPQGSAYDVGAYEVIL